MGYDIIERHNCGMSVERTTPEEIAEKIRTIKELSSDTYADLCKNARKAVEEFDIPNLSDKYIAEIERIIIKFNSKKRKGDK